MSKSNKSAKEALIRLYGKECFIEKLQLRPDTERKYKGKAQYHRMKQLTYHHILERSKRRKSDSREWSFIIRRKSRMVQPTKQTRTNKNERYVSRV